MNLLVKKIGLSLLLAATVVVAQANSGQAHGEHDNVRAERPQQDSTGQNESHAGRSYQHPNSNRASEEGFKKHSRLSPEERRTLRRQINEAGQDLYIRKP